MTSILRTCVVCGMASHRADWAAPSAVPACDHHSKLDVVRALALRDSQQKKAAQQKQEADAKAATHAAEQKKQQAASGASSEASKVGKK